VWISAPVSRKVKRKYGYVVIHQEGKEKAEVRKVKRK
jgi:hypothetical protein